MDFLAVYLDSRKRSFKDTKFTLGRIVQGLYNIAQFRTITIMGGINDRIFQGSKVLKHKSACGKVLAGYNDFLLPFAPA